MTKHFARSYCVTGLALLLTASVAAQQPAPTAPPPMYPAATTPAAATPALAQAAPQQVLSVVHTLSGIELLRLLERSGVKVVDPSYPIDQNEVHTRIAAGYALGDSGNIMTRLPRAEIESLYQAYSVTTAPRSAPEAKAAETAGQNRTVDVTPPSDTNLFVLRSNGLLYKAKFLGYDSATQLSLLQADGLPTAPAADADLARINLEDEVRIVAPEESHKPLKAVPNRLILSLGEVRGRISNIVREAGGEVRSLSLTLDNLTLQHAREVIGGVVLNQRGETIGMVAGGDANTAKVIPLNAMRKAAERVRGRMAKPGQPWLGVIGQAVSAVNVELFQTTGWKRAAAQSIHDKQRGVLLTSVPCGTPAADSNLRPGDVVIRVNETEIADADDLSNVMGRAEVETPLTFVVLRPNEVKPVTLTIKLRYSFNPANDTREAIARCQGWPGQPLAVWGVEKYNLTPQLAEKFGASGGWLVMSVQKESLAEKSGLQAGDVIERINGQAIEPGTPAALPTVECRLGIVRRGQRLEIAITEKH